MGDSNTAIDFRKLLREEKKARRRQPKKHADEDKESPQCSQKGAIPEKEYSNFDWNLSDLPQTLHLSECVSDSNLSSIYYLSRFLDLAYSNQLIQWLQRLPCASSQDDPSGRWNTMRYAKRRVALFDGTIKERSLPMPLNLIAASLVTCGIFDTQHKPNHVLINQYTETQGIMPHTDGPLYYNKTATISIGGGDVLLKFTPRLSTNEITKAAASAVVKEVWLEGHGSLVVFCNEAYTNYCHGIDDEVMLEHASDKCINAKPGTVIHRGYRISLTFRHKLCE